MAPIPSPTSGRIPLPELNNHHHQQHQQIQPAGGAQSHFHSGAEHDDFFDQMLSALPAAWSDLGNPKSPWDLGGAPATESAHKLFNMALADKPPEDNDALEYPPYDESSLLASRLRQHQISGGEKPMGLQLNHPTQQHQQHMLFHGLGRSPGGAADAGLIPLPLSLGSDDVMDRSRDEGGEGMYNGFSGQLHRVAATPSQQHFHNPQSYGGAVPPPAAAAAGAAAPPPRQRVRARRGQATDPHSIAERLRRERIAERMKALQELVPNANKTDKASMLDEIIDYVKFLQLQVKVLSMSRLGGAGAVAPLVADISSEAGRGNAAAGSDSLAVTEHQVAKLMEEDMGTAMQYLQGKGLCLMPISLASAISTAGCTPRNPGGAAAALSGLLGAANSGLMLAPPVAGGDAPTSPSMSVLTVQSAIANGGDTNSNVKEVGSVSKP